MTLAKDVILAVSSVGVGIFATYTLMKLKQLNDNFKVVMEMINDIPTPEELAKQVLRVKLPISDVPEDVKEQLREMAKKYQQPPNPPQGKPKKADFGSSLDYVG